MHWRGTIHECSDAPAWNPAVVFLPSVSGPAWSLQSGSTAGIPPAFFISSGFGNLCRAHQFGRKTGSTILLASFLEHGSSMQYRAETTSVEGFVQQIACCYLRHGYWFYVKGRVPDGKRPEHVDEKLIDKYRINVSESTRARRKKAGRSNLQYIRHESTFVILATKGEHRFFDEESNLIRDIRRVPIRYAGYSISYKPGGRNKDGSNDDRWHAHVEIDRDQYLDLRAWFSERALRDSPDRLAKAFYELPIAPYAPVRRQMLMLLREVNRVRKVGGKKPLPHEILPLSRRVVKPFGVSPSRQRQCSGVRSRID